MPIKKQRLCEACQEPLEGPPAGVTLCIECDYMLSTHDGWEDDFFAQLVVWDLKNNP
jgi:hypothetical protein